MLNIGRYGRFANAAFQCLAVLGIAKKNNLEPVFLPFTNHDHRDRFGSTEDVDLQKYFVHQLPPIPEGISWQPERGYGWGYQDIVVPPGNWNIAGHFQSKKYWQNCTDQASHYFRMIGEGPIEDVCSIHVRLQDYDGGYHPRLDMRYYEPAMAQFPHSKFLVFSDDIPEAKRMFGDRVEYSEGLDYIGDFRRLKRCRDFIVGNSSYSALAALLNDSAGRVVAPRPWFGRKYTEIDGEDIYDYGWTVVNYETGEITTKT